MWRRQYLPLCIAKTGDYRKVSVYARALLCICKIDFIVPRKYVFKLDRCRTSNLSSSSITATVMDTAGGTVDLETVRFLRQMYWTCLCCRCASQRMTLTTFPCTPSVPAVPVVHRFPPARTHTTTSSRTSTYPN